MKKDTTLEDFISQVNELRALGENVDGAEEIVGAMTSNMSKKKQNKMFGKMLPPNPTPTPTPNANPYIPHANVSPSAQDTVPHANLTPYDHQLNTIDDYYNKYPINTITK